MCSQCDFFDLMNNLTLENVQAISDIFQREIKEGISWGATCLLSFKRLPLVTSKSGDYN